MACSLYAMNACKKYLNSTVLMMIYYAMLYPYLAYGILLWGSSYKTYLHEIDVMQRGPLGQLLIELTMPTLMIFSKYYVLL